MNWNFIHSTVFIFVSWKVLCLKNLSAHASVAQLVALFSRFEREGGPPVLYRLLTGRMKGQAFITLPGEKQLLHGIDQTADRATMFSHVSYWQTLKRPREPCS